MKWSRLEQPLSTGAIVLLVIAAWEGGVAWLDIPPYLVPSLSETVKTAIVEADEVLIPASLITLNEALWGLAAATVVGVTLGMLAAKSKTLERAFMPYIVASQAVPMLAIAPLLIIWFGFGLAPKVIATALICFFPIVINTFAGMRSMERDIGHLMTSLQATRAQVILKIQVPAAVPFIFAGFKNAVVFAVIGALVAEWVGATGGLGPVIIRALGSFETPLVFAAILYIVAMSISLFVMTTLVERSVIRWLYGATSQSA